ncbi:MAG: response regulator [Deltaproteobacteria bacterium]|nr:response regulator [Deltaproteobacteria bacterium]MBW2300999.1 response regulator [Deltaproteobacteria bacterium]
MSESNKIKRELELEAEQLRRRIGELEESEAESTKARADLEKALDQAQSIIDAVRNPMLVLDHELKVVSANKSFYDTFKVKPQETQGRNLYKLGKRKWDLPELRTLLDGVREQNADFEHHEVEHEFEKIGRRIMRLHGKPIYSNGKKTNLIALTIEDVTEQKKLEEQLIQAQKMEALGRVTAAIAHDFNNILTAIVGNSHLLLMDLGEGDPRREEVEEIVKASEKASALISQLMAFSRKQPIKPRALNLNEILADMEGMLRRTMGEDVEFASILEPDLGLARVDASQIEQVIMNLSVNARDAMSGGGKLTFETANVDLDPAYFKIHGVEPKPGPYVMLAVTDSGTGIEKDVQNKIFDPFFTTKQKGKGAGLGLSTVYGIVKQNGGFIWVYSEPGQGTTFKIYFPRAEKEVEKSVPGEKEPSDELVGSETILFVDDDDMVRNIGVKTLQMRGYKVLEARSPKEALDISARYQGPIHLLLTDVVMPEMDGAKLVTRLETQRPEMIVLYMSGYTDNAILHRGVLPKGTKFLQKPFAPESLARKVRDVLDGSA